MKICDNKGNIEEDTYLTLNFHITTYFRALKCSQS